MIMMLQEKFLDRIVVLYIKQAIIKLFSSTRVLPKNLIHIQFSFKICRKVACIPNADRLTHCHFRLTISNHPIVPGGRQLTVQPAAKGRARYVVRISPNKRVASTQTRNLQELVRQAGWDVWEDRVETSHVYINTSSITNSHYSSFSNGSELMSRTGVLGGATLSSKSCGAHRGARVSVRSCGTSGAVKLVAEDQLANGTPKVKTGKV